MEYLRNVPSHYIDTPTPIKIISPSSINGMFLLVPHDAGRDPVMSAEDSFTNDFGIEAIHHCATDDSAPTIVNNIAERRPVQWLFDSDTRRERLSEELP